MQTMNNELRTILERAGKSLLLGILIPISVPFIIVIWPFLYLFKHIYALARGMHYDDQTEEYISEEEYKKRKEDKRREKQKERITKEIEEGKIKTTDLPHVTKHPFTSFLCAKDSKDNLPYDAVAYIESEPNETIRKFFTKETDWVTQLSIKYGIDLIQPNYDRIRSIMLFPQDFKELHHGIIWRTNTSTWDGEYGLYGYIYLYIEINPNSYKTLKQQLEDAMIKIYDCILNHSLVAI